MKALGRKNLLRDKYTRLKFLTIILGALGIPLGTYVGICFAQGGYFRFGLFLGLEILLYSIDMWIYLKLLEQMPIRALRGGK
jgi:hypothetical protein